MNSFTKIYGKLFILRGKNTFTIVFSFFILLVILSEMKSFISYGRFLINDFPQLTKIDMEYKREIIDGDLYRFVRECKQIIPKNRDLYYVPTIDTYDFHPHEPQELYFKRKLDYYFFPQRIIYLKSNFKNFNKKIIKPNFTDIFYLCF